MKILLTLIFLLLSTNAEARVKRGTFTSDGDYIMDYEKNDYKRPNRNKYYNNYQNYKGDN